MVACALVTAIAIAADRNANDSKPVVRSLHQSYEGPGSVAVLDNGALIVNKSASFESPDTQDVFLVIGQRDKQGLIKSAAKNFSIGDSQSAKAGGDSYTPFVRTDEFSAEGTALLDLPGEMKIDVSAHRDGSFTVTMTMTGEDGSTFSHQWQASRSPLDPPVEGQGEVAWVSECSVTCDNGTGGSVSCSNQQCYAFCKGGRPQYQVPRVGCGSPPSD